MVECEYGTLQWIYLSVSGFNRYMVECEWSLWSNVTEVVFVLIDTWWNVNKKQELGKNWAKKVLIDTWWNVNETVLNYALNGASGFNRYMVECECYKKYGYVNEDDPF